MRACGALGERLVEDRELAVGAGAAGEDLAGVRDFGEAAEMAGILVDQRQDFFEQIGIGDDRAAAEIDEDAGLEDNGYAASPRSPIHKRPQHQMAI